MRSAFLAVGLLLLACGCDVGGSSSAKGGNAMRVTREDGSRLKFSDDLHAFCARASNYVGTGKPGPVELWVVAGRLPPEKEDVEPTTLWLFSRSTREIERERRMSLPDEGEAPTHAAFFVFDSETENELASDQEESKGTIDVREWGCNKGDKVRLAVDGRLSSEFFQSPTVEVRGEVETVIGDPLPIPD